MIFIRSANIVPCYLIFLSILRRREARRVHVEKLMSQTSSYLKLRHTRCEHFCIIFVDLSATQPEFILDYWNKSGDFWDSLSSIVSIVPIISVV